MLQGRKLLSQSEVLGGELRSVKEHATDEQQHDTSGSHFTASKSHHQALKSLATVSRASICKSFIDKAYGINNRDTRFEPATLRRSD